MHTSYLILRNRTSARGSQTHNIYKLFTHQLNPPPQVGSKSARSSITYIISKLYRLYLNVLLADITLFGVKYFEI